MKSIRHLYKAGTGPSSSHRMGPKNAVIGGHRVSFDEVVDVMKQTGLDVQPAYKETAVGGLVRICLKSDLTMSRV